MIRVETKRGYFEALTSADRGDIAPVVGFVADAALTTQQSVLDVLAP